MTTSTAEQTVEEPRLSQPRAGIEFISRRTDLRLIKTPRYPITGPGGQKVGEQPGQALLFVDGRFYCPSEGTVVLEDGREADAAEILAFLKSHRLNGNLYEGFGESVAPAPAPSGVELDAIMQAAENYDVERLEALIAQEESGWNRETILAVARASLGRIRETRAAIDADAAAQVAAQPTPPVEPVTPPAGPEPGTE